MGYVLRIYLPGIIFGLYFLIDSIMKGYWPPVVAGWVLVSGLGIATGYHRVYSHKTHNLKPWLDNIVLFFGTLGGQGSSISWVAVHRGYHHRFSDTHQDLHSPASQGVFQALIGWYWKIGPESVNNKYAVDLLRKKNHVWFHRHYTKILFGWIAFCGLISYGFDIPFLEAYLAVLFLSLFQDNMVNVLCHTKRFGYRNHSTQDQSVNVWLLGYFGWGQGWHNNHHAHPQTYSFGTRWWEFDPCVVFLPLLKVGSKH